MTYRVRIEPVTGNATPVIGVIMRLLGPDSRERAEQLVREGGVVMGGLDPQTADQAADILKDVGAVALIELEGNSKRALTIMVLDRMSKKPIQGAQVEVVGNGRVFASDTTGAKGEATFKQFKALALDTYGDELPEVTVQVHWRGRLLDVSHPPFSWETFDAAEGDFLLTVVATRVTTPNPDEEPDDEDRYVVHGRVSLPNAETADQLTVRAYDRDLRSRTLLGEDVTDAEGRYEISYDPATAKAGERGGADLELRVYTRTGRELAAEMEADGLTKVGGTSVLFNAGENEEIDITVISKDAKLSLYEEVVADITPLLEDVELADLTADDVLFLHHDTGRPVKQITYAAEDARLRRQTGMLEGVFFGLGMEDVGVVESDVEGVPRLDLAAILEHPVDKATHRGVRTLMDAVDAALDPEQEQDPIKIPARLRSQMDTIRTRFEELKETHRVESDARRKERTEKLGRISGLDEDASRRLAERIPSGPRTDEAWAALVEAGVVEEEQLPDLRLTFDLSDLTNQHIELVETIKTKGLPQVIGPVHSTRDLVALDASNWMAVLVDHDIDPPEDQDEQTYARQLAWDVERLHPTPVFTHRTLQTIRQDRADVPRRLEQVQSLLEGHDGLFTRLASAKNRVADINLDGNEDVKALASLARTFRPLGVPQVLDDNLTPADKAQEVERRIQALDTFFENNADFDLRTVDLVGLATEERGGAALNFDGIDETLQPHVKQQLKGYQRVMTLAPHAEAAGKLQLAGFWSAYDVSKLPLNRFAEEVDLRPGEAAAIHTQALVFHDYTNFVAGSLVPYSPSALVPLNVDNVDEGFVNRLRELDSFEELFGNETGCDCEHCKSIFGPLAYFVDLMSWVEKNFIEATTALRNNEEHPLHLKKRRPDLWTLKLTCENATGLVPYLDVVNKVLTDYVRRAEALASGEEASGEEVFEHFSSNDRAYSFDQPVHFPLEEIRLGLERLGVSLPEVVERSWGDAGARMRARLGLSKEEVDAVTTSIADDEDAIRRRYGLSTDQDLTRLTTQQLMAAAGISREELGRLAVEADDDTSLNFIGKFSIETAREEGALQPTHEVVHGLNKDRLDRIFRFVRLWRALPWTFEELDHVIDVLKPESSGEPLRLDEAVLEGIAELLRLQEALRLSVAQVCALVDKIPTRELQPGQQSLYDRLFNKDIFVQQEVHRFESDAPQPQRFSYPLSADSTSTDVERDPALPRLLSALQVSEEAFVELMRHLQKQLTGSDAEDDSSTPVQLTRENLSLLYRHALVARRLDLSIDELFRVLHFVRVEDNDQLPADLEAHAVLRFLNWIEITNDADGTEKRRHLDGSGAGLVVQFVKWIREANLAIGDVAFITGETLPGRLVNQQRIVKLVKSGEERVRFTASAFENIPDLDERVVSAFLRMMLDNGSIVQEREEVLRAEKDVYRLTAAYDPTALDSESLPLRIREKFGSLLRVLNRFLPEEHAADVLLEELDVTYPQLRVLNAVVTGSKAQHGRALSRSQGLQLTSIKALKADPEDVTAFIGQLKDVAHTIKQLGLINIQKAEAIVASAQERVRFTAKAFGEISGLEEQDLSEFLQIMVEGGRVEEDEGVYRLTAEHDSMALPPLPGENLEEHREELLSMVNRFLPEEHAAELLAEALDVTNSRLRALIILATGIVADDERALSRTQGLSVTTGSTCIEDTMVLLARLGRVAMELVRTVEQLKLTDEAFGFAARHHEMFNLEVETEHPVGLEALRRLAIYAALRKRFKEQAPELDAFLTDAALGQDLSQADAASALRRLADKLAALAGVSLELARSILVHAPTHAEAIDAAAAIIRALDLARELRTSGAGLAQLNSKAFGDLKSARDLVWAALHDSYDEEEQREAALKPIHDRMRSRKRDVLVSHILAHAELGFDDASDLYHYFLLDTEMEGCAQTSPVVAATMSLQLYVHRCFMQLEQSEDGQVHVRPAETLKEEWAWRKNYRVWEANRKVFLNPETYLEPDLRDNKTPPFKELEARLMEEDLDEAAAERLFRGYLDQYHEVANLHIAGAYFEPDSDGPEGMSSEGTVYIVGRTSSQPSRFYLRTWGMAKGHWSAWERIDVEINAREVSPILYLGRLYLFWIESKTKPWYRKSDDSADNFVGYHHQVKLKFTSSKAEGGWSAPQDATLPPSMQTVEDNIVWRDRRESPYSEIRSISDRESISVPRNIVRLPVPILQLQANPAHAEKYSVGYKRQELVGSTETVDLVDQLAYLWDIFIHYYYNHDVYNYVRININNLDWLDPAPLDNYSLDARLFNRIFPFKHAGHIYFRYGYSSSTYRITFRDRHVTIVSHDDEPEGVLAYHNDVQAGTLRKVQRKEWLYLPEGHDRLELVALYLAINNENDKYQYYYESEAERNGEFLPDLDSVEWWNENWWQGNVPSDAKIESVNNAPHLWILDRDTGAALLYRNEHDAFDIERLRTRVPEELQNHLFREGLESMLSIYSQSRLRESRLIEDVEEEWHREAKVLTPQQAFDTYNWEVFFHAPLLIANALNARGQYEEAERWYNVVFDPTAGEGWTSRDNHSQDRNWRFLPLRGITPPKLKDLLDTSSDAYEVYRTDPFNPHAVARARIPHIAYQRGVVMKYIDNLLDWADELFTRDTRESINEATLLYITAADILGKRPPKFGACKQPKSDTTYDTLEADGGFIVTLENFLQSLSASEREQLSVALLTSSRRDGQLASDDAPPAGGDGEAVEARLAVSSSWMPPVEGAGGFTMRGTLPVGEIMRRGSLPTVPEITETGDVQADVPTITGLVPTRTVLTFDRPVFCIPQNKDLLAYWDRVEDRLFKIRNCMNIHGVRRTLALFAPPIDPALLIRAKAAGLTLDEILGAATAELPPYRFSYLIGKAKEYVSTLRGLGGSLLAALEKKDAEELVQLRSVHQQNIQRMTKRIRRQQIEAAKESVRSLEDQRNRVQVRLDHVQEKIDAGWNAWEFTSVSLSTAALASHATAATMAALVPPVKAGTPYTEAGYASLGGFFTVEWGPEQTGGSLQAAAQVVRDVTAGLNMGAGIASTIGSFERRAEEWEIQRDLAEMELDQLEKDIIASEIRVAMAEREHEVHEAQMEQTEEVYDFYKTRFSNLGLYTWLASELKGLYRQAYRMALEVARMAEAAYRYERDESAFFIEPDAWDGERAGLLSGERLMMQLQEMDKAYLESNRRDFEVDQTFSLAQINPLALHQLREAGTCEFSIPEAFFDVAYPGQYKRRIKSVRLSIPCVTGPYTNVNAKLTLLQSRVRKEANSNPAALIAEPRSRNVSIATSRAQNDGGVFNLNFRDERYMPFEGAGAVSDWRLELPGTFRSFDYDTIADVLVHISYMAKEDSGSFREAVEEKMHTALNAALSESNGLYRAFSLCQEFATEFRHLFMPSSTTQQTVNIQVEHRHFPHLLRRRTLQLQKAVVALKLREPFNEQYGTEDASKLKVALKVKPDDSDPQDGSLVLEPEEGISELQKAKLPHHVFSSSSELAPHTSGLSITLEVFELEAFLAAMRADNGSGSLEEAHEIIEDIYLILQVDVGEEV